MDIMELGAIGELVGGVAVVATLLYLALQVRQSNKTARSESMRAIAAEARQNFLMLCDPDLALVVRRGRENFAELSKNDQTRVGCYFSAISLTAQTTFAVRDSTKPSKLEQVVAAYLTDPGLRPWWEAARGQFSPNFVANLEQLASQGAVLSIDEILPWWRLEEGELGAASR